MFDNEYDDVVESARDEISRAVLDGLPLLHMRGILFVEAAWGELSDYSEPSTFGYEPDEVDEADELEEDGPW